MALYRNIAGFLDERRVGLSLATSSLTFIEPSSTYNTISPFKDPVAYQQQQANLDAAYRTEMVARYDWLLSHSYAEVTAAGYYVHTDDGSIFQSDQVGGSASYLSLDWIQAIENERGTAGALLMHLQEPALAKDTAGYAGGSSGTWYGDNAGSETVTDPIASVKSLPPVIADGDSVAFEAPGFPGAVADPASVAPATTTATAIPTTQTPLPVNPASALKNNLLSVSVLAGLVVVAVAGDELLHNRRKVVFLGGVGALFYLMAKKS